MTNEQLLRFKSISKKIRETTDEEESKKLMNELLDLMLEAGDMKDDLDEDIW